MTATDSGVLTSAEFDALFDSFRSTVVRLEQLPAYAVGGAEADRIRAFQAGEPRPERSVRTSPWLARIATSTVNGGKTWLRVRVVDDPLTDYQRYQLASYVESQAAGERVFVAPRTSTIDVPDFWLFDAGAVGAHAVLMRYHPDGRLDRREHVDDPDLIDGLLKALHRVEEVAEPLNEFLAGVARG